MKISDFYSGLYPIREAKLQEIPKKLFPIFLNCLKRTLRLDFVKFVRIRIHYTPLDMGGVNSPFPSGEQND